MQSGYHRWYVSPWVKDYTLNMEMPIDIMSMKLLNDWQSYMQPMVPIPDHEHLIQKNLQIIICKKCLLQFFIHQLPLRRPLRHHTRGHVIGVPMVVLQCHIKETIPLHVAISHKMSCELGYVVLEVRSHHMKRHHAAEGNEETTILFWLPF